MFKKGQLVRSRESGEFYIVLHSATRRTPVTLVFPVTGEHFYMDERYLELTGNNYKEKRRV